MELIDEATQTCQFSWIRQTTHCYVRDTRKAPLTKLIGYARAST
jgi:hypothetical protein